MKGFNEIDAIELIKDVKEAKNNGKSLLFVFNEYAQKKQKSMGSVRNYYYKTIKKCKQSESLKQKLGLDESLYPAFIIEFNLSEERSLLKSVLKGITLGKSVRKVISEISYGNEKLALRNQNKYRNLLKTKPQLVNDVILEVEIELGKCKNPYLEISNNLASKLALEESINNLILDLQDSEISENYYLKKKVKELSIKNQKMKDLLKKALQNNDITKEFIKKVT